METSPPPDQGPSPRASGTARPPRHDRVATTGWRAMLRLLTLASWLATVLAVQAAGKKVVVLGIDGMDPQLLQRFVAEGRMPHFKALMAEGDFRPLQTTMPPQSPVAWSTFMTGMDPGGHGIFDFIHVDQK